MTWKKTIKKNRPPLTRENILVQELPLNDKTEREIIAGKYKMFDIPQGYTEDYAKGYIIDGVKIVVDLKGDNTPLSTFAPYDNRTEVLEVAKKIMK
tara:strand:- start:258 stop:545 length:288 start_codon:yes stop_codon:yes gene_type:complete